MPRKYDKCRYPACNGTVTPVYSHVGLCNRHGDLLEFIMWVLNNVRQVEPTAQGTKASTVPIK